MKKRKVSDFIKDDIRKKRKEYAKKRNKETKIEADIRKKIHAQIPNGYSPYSDEDRILYSKNYHNLKKTPCPEILCLDSNAEETINFLKRLPGAYILNKRPDRKISHNPIKNYKPSKIKLYFDFASIKKICPASALIISSCYFIYKRRGGKITVFDWEDWDEGVKDTLAKMGFFELLEFDPIETDKKLQDIPIKGFISGNVIDAEAIAEYVESLVQRVNEKTLIGKERNPFKEAMPAIKEAVENSSRYAFPNASLEDESHVWWFGGTISPDARTITLICYDKGVSIPKHIKEAGIKEEMDLEERGQKLREHIRTAIDRLTAKIEKAEVNNNLDHKRLEFAIKMALTSAQKDGSGRGLGSITETIKDFSYGKVKIMSRRASAMITKDKASRFTLLDTPIIGTLIIWEITL